MTTTDERPAARSLAERVLTAAFRPVDVASLAALRVLFGALLFVGTTRFVLSGWIEKLYAQPTFFFKYWGFSWVEVWPLWGMYLHYGALIVLALFIALGLYTRVAVTSFLLLFAWLQLMDVTNYLNHYYLVVLLLALMALLPVHAAFSLDVRRRPELARASVPAWTVWLLRFQLGVVYVFASLAKVGEDWLLFAQPLGIWLGTKTHLPLIGAVLSLPGAVWLFSWAGFLYDLTIVGWLSWRKTRVLAYLTVLLFHGLTSVFFSIGMFPLIMIVSTTVFFSPSWPRRFLRGAAAGARRFPRPTSVTLTRARKVGLAAFAVYALLQVGLPLRHLLYPGDVLWGEQGMRWSWRVMVREKDGAITYRVRQRSTGREWLATPFDYLTWRQAHEMSGQPDLILQLAHHIARDFERRGLGEVEVRVDALVSLNGRAPARLIDPDVDLTKIEDGLGVASWILPAPDEPPLLPRGAPAVLARGSR